MDNLRKSFLVRGNNIVGFSDKNFSICPIGTVLSFAGQTAPNGYLLCDGASYKVADYPDLYAVIGNTYGGDTENFNVPNLVDKFIQGSTTSGKEKEAGLPNITGGWMPSVPVGYENYVTGAVAAEIKSSGLVSSSGTQLAIGAGFKIDASKSSAVYGNSDTVQPPALTMVYIIKAFHTNEGVDSGVSDDVINYVDNKVAKKIDKTDIATTIDGTSTDTQVPSAKAVYDKYSLHDLSEASTNVLDNALLVDTQNQNGAVNKDCLVTSSSIQIPNDLLWGIRQVFWHANSDLVLKITGKDINNKSCIWINSLSLKDGEHYWQGWLKNATTSVADVGWTVVTTTNPKISGGYIKYRVKNGICFVSVGGVESSATRGQTISNSLPKADSTNMYGGALTGSGDGENNGYMFISNGSTLIMNIKNTNTALYGSFSYPVAES